MAHADLALAELPASSEIRNELHGLTNRAGTRKGERRVRTRGCVGPARHDAASECVDLEARGSAGPSDPRPSGDPRQHGAAQLRQLVLNLVTNASEGVGEDGGFI